MEESEFWKDFREDLKDPEFRKAYIKESRKFMSIRDRLETYRWYWFSINLSYNVFPWHWEMTWDKYRWGINVKFGPFGALILWH